MMKREFVDQDDALVRDWAHNPSAAEFFVDRLAEQLCNQVMHAFSTDEDFLKFSNDFGDFSFPLEGESYVNGWRLRTDVPVGELNFGQGRDLGILIAYIDASTSYEDIYNEDLRGCHFDGEEEKEAAFEEARVFARLSRRMSGTPEFLIKKELSLLGEESFSREVCIFEVCRNAIVDVLNSQVDYC